MLEPFEPPFPVSFLALMLRSFSSMLDTGKHDDISIDEVKLHARKGDLIQFLNEKAGYPIDNNFSQAMPLFALWFVNKIHENCTVMSGSEMGKYGVENRGLCLLISYTAEIIQEGKDIKLTSY